MAEPHKPTSLDYIPEAVVEKENRGFPVVWLLPLVAILVGGWLIYKTMSEKGPQIEISFKTAAGIEQGKTKIKYRDVMVGTVDTVRFSKDISKIIVTATMETGTESALTENTRFWVVRPRIGAGGITGLGTLVSGAYIEMEPSQSGEKQREFTGLEFPPVVTSDVAGTTYRLRSEKLGSLSVGAPVYFRQFDVGEITEYNLSDDHDYVNVSIFVQSPHDRFIRTGTRFWNVGGVSLTMDASGIELQMESLISLMSGGVAFDTPPTLAKTPIAEEDTLFKLYDNKAQTLQQAITETITYVAKFKTVRGLNIDAPVEFRGIRIGSVKAIEMGIDPAQKDVLVPVVIFDLEPERWAGYKEAETSEIVEEALEESLADPRERIEKLVRKGLRARLGSGNLVTGQLFIDLDFIPDAEPATIIQGSMHPEFPTAPNPLEGILAGIDNILDKLEKAELNETVENLNALLNSTNSLMVDLDKRVPILAKQVQATLEGTRDTLESLQSLTSTDGEIGNELYNALAEVTAAARSIRVMSEYLERHPEALLLGKDHKP